MLFFMSVCAALAAPRLWSASMSARLDAEAARLAAALMEFRGRVMTRQAPHASFPGVASEAQAYFNLTRSGYSVVSGSVRLEHHALSDGIELSAPRTQAAFTASGNGSPMTIVLLAGKEARYVIIDLAGRVRVSLSPPKS